MNRFSLLFTRLLLPGALLLALLVQPCRGQLLLLKPGISNINSTDTAAPNDALTIGVSFSDWDKANGNVTLRLFNYGGTGITRARMVNFNFTAPFAGSKASAALDWGAVKIMNWGYSWIDTSIVRPAPVVPTSPTLSSGTDFKTPALSFGQMDFRYSINLASSGGGTQDGIEVGMTGFFVLNFKNVNSSTTAFDLAHLFGDSYNGTVPVSAKGYHDIGYDVQPLNSRSDKYYYEYSAAEIPPIPEPSTYGLCGMACLLGILGLRRGKSKRGPRSMSEAQ